MTTSLAHRIGAAAAGLLLTACFVQGMNNPPVPSLELDWVSTLEQASQEVIASRYAVADKILADFAARHRSSAEGNETGYWRALYKVDPANQTGSRREAAALLDDYLATSPATVRRVDALVLRRIVGSLERAATTAASGTQPGSTARAEDKARDDELQRLKDELAKANAELERIKRRVTQQKP